MLQRFVRQFSGPEGALGHVAGWLMARQNVPANAWAVDLLDAGPGDRVIEIGFGPGLAVAMNARRVAASGSTAGGFVAGVDRSELMVRKARARARGAATATPVDLRLGSAEKLPFADGSFTRALTVNSLRFWRSTAEGLRELARVLVPGARLVVALRLFRPGAGRFDRSRFGATGEHIAEVTAALAGAGFEDGVVHRRDVGGESVAALVAQRARRAS